MNTIGKILVILNFLFAVIVGLLLVADFAVRNQWKEAYLELKKQTEQVDNVRKTNANAMITIANDYQKARDKIDDLSRQIKEVEDKAKANEAVLVLEKENLKNSADNAKLVNDELLKAKQRLTDEIAHLKTVVKDREVQIVRFEADVKSYRHDTVQFEG